MSWLEKIFSIKKSQKYRTITILSILEFNIMRKSYIGDIDKKNKQLELMSWHERFAPLGHFYSVEPCKEDIERHLHNDFLDVSNIELNVEGQKSLLEEMTNLSKDIDFEDLKEDIKDNKHYYFKNEWFGEGDGMFLNMFLRKFQPKKIIEIGSGFSTAMMLDTYKYYLKKDIDLTCIEPYPDRLYELVQESDKLQIIDKQLQDISYESITNELNVGDLLFIDSTHVMKYGSDVLYIFNKMLPNLKKGVFVHFHDIAYPFENFKHWIEGGRNWNEVYFLKQFLAYNNAWDIVLWPNMMWKINKEYLMKNFPKMEKSVGASIYLKRKN